MNETHNISREFSLGKKEIADGFDNRFLACLLLSIGIITGNILIITVASSRKKVFQSILASRLITALAAVDLVIGVFFSFSVPNVFLQRWIYGDTLCTLMADCSSAVFIAEFQIIALISLERYIAICRPLHYHLILTRGKCIAVSIFVGLVVSAFILVPPLAGIPSQVQQDVYMCQLIYKDFSGSSYLVAFVALGFVLPLCAVTFSNIQIVRAIRQQRTRIHEMNRPSNQPVRIDKGSFISVLLVVIMCTTFLPFLISLPLSYFHPEVKVSQFWPSIIFGSNSFWNIVLYIFWNKSFRLELMQVLRCK